MSALLKALSAITPPPSAPAPREYSGYELRWKAFVFRPSYFKFEGYALGILGLYLLLFFIGKTINQSRAKKTAASLTPFLQTQFTQTRPLLSSSSALHLIYSSGRRNLLSLHTTINLLPLHDVALLVYQFGKSIIEPTFDGSESLIFQYTLGRGNEGLQGDGVGVWGVVDKNALRETKSKRWDLTFPRLSENAAMPITHVLFTEHSDCTDLILKTPNVGVAELISNPAAASVLKYFLITDVSSRRPSKGPLAAKAKSREIVLAVYKPKTAAQEAAVKAWVQVGLNVADLLGKPNVVKPEVTRKLVKTRQQVDQELQADYKKVLAEDAPAEETAEEKRAAKKRAERAAMSEKELKRVEELEKKREFRKAQKKQVKG